MKITIYELLGLVKDGKAPKKVLVNDNWYEYNRWGNDYNDINMPSNYWLFKDYIFGSNGNRLNDEIEIIEEEIEEEKKMPEKIKSNGDEFYCDYIESWINKEKASAYCEFLGNKINEIIDYLKSKENKV